MRTTIKSPTSTDIGNSDSENSCEGALSVSDKIEIGVGVAIGGLILIAFVRGSLHRVKTKSLECRVRSEIPSPPLLNTYDTNSTPIVEGIGAGRERMG